MRRVVYATPGVREMESPELELMSGDSYRERLLKYIPGEVIAVYVTLYSVAKSAGDTIPQVLIQWLIFLIVASLTPFYVNLLTSEPGYNSATKQIVISTAAFIVWVFALGGPFELMTWYNPVYGALALPLYTFMIPIIKGDPLRREGT